MTNDIGLAPGFGDRLAEIEGAIGRQKDAAEVAGVSEVTLRRWVRESRDAKFDALARMSRAAGYSLEWLAFAVEPKLRDYGGTTPATDHIGRNRAEAIYETILRDISGFLDRRGWNMTLRRQHQLAEEFLDYVIRYDEADTRAAVLEVLIETRIPVVYEEQTAHEKVGPPSGRPGSEPPEEPSK